MTPTKRKQAVMDDVERLGFVVTIPAELAAELAADDCTVEVLVRRWEDGTVTADTRTARVGHTVWSPVACTEGGMVELVRV